MSVYHVSSIRRRCAVLDIVHKGGSMAAVVVETLTFPFHDFIDEPWV
jgi:hypothetical protein